jgi:hypothetical protein
MNNWFNLVVRTAILALSEKTSDMMSNLEENVNTFLPSEWFHSDK